MFNSVIIVEYIYICTSIWYIYICVIYETLTHSTELGGSSQRPCGRNYAQSVGYRVRDRVITGWSNMVLAELPIVLCSRWPQCFGGLRKGAFVVYLRMDYNLRRMCVFTIVFYYSLLIVFVHTHDKGSTFQIHTIHPPSHKKCQTEMLRLGVRSNDWDFFFVLICINCIDNTTAFHKWKTFGAHKFWHFLHSHRNELWLV